MKKCIAFKLSTILMSMAALANAQFTQIGNQITNPNTSDTVLLKSTKNTTLTINGGIQVNNKTGGDPCIIVVAPSTLPDIAGQAVENRENIQNAINTVSARGSGTVLLHGAYYVSKASGQNYCLLLNHGVILRGVSKAGTAIIPIENGNSYAVQLEVIRLQLISNTNTFVTGSIYDLTVKGEGKSNITGINLNNYATTWGGALNFILSNVNITDCSIGVIVGSYGSQIDNCNINGANTVGIALKHYWGIPPSTTHTDGTTVTTVKNCHIGPSDTCIVVEGSGCLITQNVLDVKNLTTGNCYGVHLDDRSISNNIVSNWFQSTQASDGLPQFARGISIGTALNTYFCSNYFDGLRRDRSIIFRSSIPSGTHIVSNHDMNGAVPDAIFNNVGINTTNPRGQFDVAGKGDIYLSQYPNGGSTNKLYLPGNIYIAPYNNISVSYLQARRADNSGTTSLQLRTTNAGATTEAVRIDGLGKVGIGTTSPSEKLDINGNLKLGSNPSLKWRSNDLIFEAPAGENIIKTIQFRATTNYAPRFDMYGANNSQVTVRLEAGPGHSFINTTQNFGIGTSTPVEKLQVSGNIRANGYKSSDGSTGVTANVPYKKADGTNGTMVIKNGLIISAD